MNLREIEMMGQIQRRDARIAELELEITALKGDSRLCGEKMSEQDKRLLELASLAVRRSGYEPR